MRAVCGLSDAEVAALVATLGGKPFHARQLARWVFARGARDYAACTDLPPALRDALAAWGPVRGSEVERVERAADGAEKLLLRLADGEAIETVVIPEGRRTTLCVSTQVGCPVACAFCASGLDGVRRNLQTSEIIEQVLHAGDRLPPSRPLTNLVVMGMGEPLLNLEALLPALARIGDPVGIGLGARRITVSTSGYPERIERFAREPQQYQLAVSLHAGDDALRHRLVPTARASVRAIVQAAARYAAAKGREVTFEVVLLAQVNDRPGDADALIDAVRAVPCTVNLIPWNPVDRIRDLSRPAAQRVDAFAARLRAGGLKVTVRSQRGADRDAACGQLRLRSAT